MIAPNNGNGNGHEDDRSKKEANGNGNGNGRHSNGKFKKGEYKGGPGNPFAKKTAALRAALLNTVTVEDVEEVVRQLIMQARSGDQTAIHEFLDRVIGRSKPAEDDDNGPIRIVVVNNDQWNRNRIAAT